ncbi:MAG: hypothetical protein ACTSR8_11075 [Promethearchaeota archaeon]
MSTIEPEIQNKLMDVLKIEENRTDLENLAVLSRVGMKVASSTSAELDADATSASSTALIDLGLRLSEATYHGALKEIVLHNNLGYTILMAINDEYIVFGGLKNPYRIGYYLAYMYEIAKKLNIIISGGEITEMALSLEESELEKLRQQEIEAEAEAAKPVVPSATEDMQALDGLLGFLDEWEKEGLDFEDLDTGEEGGIVSIPKSMSIGIPEAGSTVGLPQSGGSVGISKDDFELPSFDDLELETEIGIPSSSNLKAESNFKIYDDEVPPIELDDYTPMDVEDGKEEVYEEEVYESSVVTDHASKEAYIYEPEEEESEKLPPLEDLPSFDELNPPDFDSAFGGSEYDVDFVLEEESESLDKVLKDLGWDESED